VYKWLEAASAAGCGGWVDDLYRTADEAVERPGVRVVGIRAVSYSAWAKREAGAMRVRLRSGQLPRVQRDGGP
jgi:hypothetical protein